MQNAKLSVGKNINGILVLIDTVTGLKVESASFNNIGIMGNSNPGLCTFGVVGGSPNTAPVITAIPLVAGSATLSLVADVSWVDQNGESQTASSMLLSKPYSVANSSDGVSLDIIF